MKAKTHWHYHHHGHWLWSMISCPASVQNQSDTCSKRKNRWLHKCVGSCDPTHRHLHLKQAIEAANTCYFPKHVKNTLTIALYVSSTWPTESGALAKFQYEATLYLLSQLLLIHIHDWYLNLYFTSWNGI